MIITRKGNGRGAGGLELTAGTARRGSKAQFPGMKGVRMARVAVRYVPHVRRSLVSTAGRTCASPAAQTVDAES